MKYVLVIILLLQLSCEESGDYSFQTSDFPHIHNYEGGIIYDFSFPIVLEQGDRLALAEHEKMEQKYYEELEEQDILTGLPEDTVEYYRFTIIPGLCVEFIVASIAREKNGRCQYSYKRFNRSRHEIIEEVSREITAEEWKQFQALIETADIWSLSNWKYWERIPFDGETWALEGFQTKEEFQLPGKPTKSEYIEVKRHSMYLEKGCFWEVCKYMEMLSHSKFERNGCVWK